MCAFLQNVAFDSFKEALISSDLNLGKYEYFCSSIMSIATLNSVSTLLDSCIGLLHKTFLFYFYKYTKEYLSKRLFSFMFYFILKSMGVWAIQ
jgi:hypothetical protein